ncbi:hypothetical protein CHCC5023_1522 [Bacillus paralicheniformis]|nr:hypothetical protein CHCC5023_1522 [Bacillus paralicheniformis]
MYIIRKNKNKSAFFEKKTQKSSFSLKYYKHTSLFNTLLHHFKF